MKASSMVVVAGLGVGALALMAQGQQFVGLTGGNALVRFDGASPLNTSAPVPVTGLSGVNERLLGIDFRPANNVLYGLSNAGFLYTVDPLTGAASRVGTGPTFVGNLNGSVFGFNFNPRADRIRVVSDTGLNLRLDPVTGAVVPTGPDASLRYVDGTDGNPNPARGIVATSYTNSFLGLTGTEQFDLDARLDLLALQAPPNDGTLQARGPLGLDLDVVPTGFEIVFNPLTGLNTGFVAVQLPAFGNSALYTVNLTSGELSFVSAIDADPLVSLTAVIPAPGSVALLCVGGLAAVRRRRQS
jgi:hypothetical protein